MDSKQGNEVANQMTTECSPDTHQYTYISSLVLSRLVAREVMTKIHFRVKPGVLSIYLQEEKID